MEQIKTLSASQPRAKRTRERLLEALETLLKAREFDQIAVADIAGEAGVSVGSVYAHFKDKDAFLETLLQRHLAKLQRRLDGEEEVPGAGHEEIFPDLRTALAAAVKSAMAQADADAHIARALAAFQRKAAETEHALLIAEAAHRRLETFLSGYSKEITAMPVAEAAALVNWFLNSVFYRRAVSTRPFLPARLTPSDDQLAASLARMLYCALADEAAPSPSS